MAQQSTIVEIVLHGAHPHCDPCLNRTVRAFLSLLLLFGLTTAGATARAQTSGANGSHDPSRMVESDGRFYVYSTGGGSKSSPDGLVWTQGPAIFSGGGIPSTTTSAVSGNEGVWAPDLIYLNGQYYLYYSIANSSSACAIGLVTSPTLDPSSPNYKWTDRGLVVSNNSSATYCTIDPAPALDAAGNLWLAWGSGYSHPSSSNTIFVTRLDNTTGLASSADNAKPGHALEQGHIEAAYIHYHAGNYYLFWNSGGCCDGAKSSYVIHMARSQTITGPYMNTRTFYSSTGSIHGPGHIGIYEQCGASRFTYHYYPDTGNSILGENELSWGSDGWPVVGAVSTTRITPCGQAGHSGSSGASTGGAGGMAVGSTGGMTGGGGRAGTVAGSGGAAQGATGGASSSGGAIGASGGTSGTGGLGGPGATGGTSGTGGTTVGGVGFGGRGTGANGSGGNGGFNVGDPSASSGCSCEFPGSADLNGGGIALLVGMVLAATRRKQRRPFHVLGGDEGTL